MTSAVSAPQTPKPERDSPHQRILEAALDCILERGFYRASSNEIARRSGMTWGAIQYYFGTRERLMLAALEVSDREFEHLLADGRDRRRQPPRNGWNDWANCCCANTGGRATSQRCRSC